MEDYLDQKPTVPGWYMWRRYTPPTPVKVVEREGVLCFYSPLGGCFPVAKDRGIWWALPHKPPCQERCRFVTHVVEQFGRHRAIVGDDGRKGLARLARVIEGATGVIGEFAPAERAREGLADAG